ncbi:hypothetical protein [Streptomyces coerulescens]|uniref:Uncharacterized protein n=1 Tax=Streptomyces coerulescens TaxID=29304 RepID=A0ABW0CN51_STRCD
MELTWHKDSAGSYYATHDGRRIATARKDGNAWSGSVVGLGHGFTGRRLTDVKELTHRHVERIYGEGEWTLFPVRDIRPGMVLGCDTWKDGEREVVSVDVDTDAQTVDVELSSESSRELGFTLDVTYAVGEYVRVKVQPEREASVSVGDVVEFYDCTATITAVGREWVTFVRQDGTTGRKPVGHDFRVIRHDEPEGKGSAPCDARRSGWERPGPGSHRLPCTLPTGHDGLHRDAFRAEWLESEAGQVLDLRPFTAIVDMIAGTGVLISPPVTEDVTLSEGGASLHDSLCADALRRLLPLGVEALAGEDGGLSLEGVTRDGRKVFSLYVSDCITAEPSFEEVAASVEALREAAGL